MAEESARGKGNIPKRHHTVPKFYLERFAVDGNVTLVKRDDFACSLPTDVTNATVEKHFYTLDLEEGRSPELEHFFANVIEPMGKNSMRRIVDEGFFPPPPGRRVALSTYCAFQFIRGAAARHVIREHYEAVCKKIASTIGPEQAREILTRDLEEGESAPTENDVDDFIAWARDPDAYRVRASSEANLHVGGTLRNAMDLIPYFRERAWMLVTFDDDVLVTGDEPIALASLSGEPGEESLGLAGAEQVFFVTDPRHAIAMIHPKHATKDAMHNGTSDLARTINRNVAYGCHRWIIHKPGTNPLRGVEIPRKGPVVEVDGGLVTMRFRPARAPTSGRSGLR